MSMVAFVASRTAHVTVLLAMLAIAASNVRLPEALG